MPNVGWVCQGFDKNNLKSFSVYDYKLHVVTLYKRKLQINKEIKRKTKKKKNEKIEKYQKNS